MNYYLLAIVIDWSAVATGSIAFFVCFVIKLLLDFDLAKFLVKYFSWISVRNYFRAKPRSIRGLWEQQWEVESGSFPADTDRHSNIELKQLGEHCYGEFTSKRVKYCVFGRVVGEFFIGCWYDSKDKDGYFGAFQLRIVNGKLLHGRWMGHSSSSHKIKHGDWKWDRIT